MPNTGSVYNGGMKTALKRLNWGTVLAWLLIGWLAYSIATSKPATEAEYRQRREEGAKGYPTP